MAGKIKALQIWCKNRLVGYKDVEITNMTTSWRDGLAFCALIHRFRPDLIDFESLSKENVFENNQLAFEVAEELGIPALLDAEDMVRLEVPDKLSIITYVAQIHNCFKDELPVGGPDTKTASKRHSTPVQRSVTMRSPDTKRRPTLQARKKSDSHGALLSGADICVVCDGKVYLIEKHIADGKLYHRSCFKTNNRKSEANALKPSSQTPDRSTAGRPSSLASSGLKKTPASLPSTPSTPPDTRPEWQKRLQEKSLAKKAAANASAAHGSPHSSLETLREDQNAAESKTKSVFETEKVKLRSRPAGNRAAAPRAVSVGVDLDERLSKLRQLRESAKASGGTSEAVKNRLERLQKVAAKGSSSNTTRDKTSSGSGDQSCDKVEPATVSEQVLDTMETDSPSSTHSNTDLSEEMVTSEEATSTKDSVGDVEKDGAKEDESPHKQSTNPFECDESDNEVGRSSPVPQQPSNDNLQNKSEQVKTAEVEEKKQADTVSELSGAIQPVAEKSTPPVRPQRRSQKVKAATANSPSAKSASPKATPVIKEKETPASPTALPLSSLNIAGNTKPPRPPVSPVGGRKEPSTPPQVKDKSNDNSSKAVHLQVPAGAPSVKSSNGIESPVAMRRQPDSRKTPPRPKTVAAGSASKSHFYLDEEHKKVLEPPPKPARQAVGKGSGWEDALEKWSVKRKNDTNRSTWYTTESYPTEHNPFGDDDEDNTGESKTDSEKLTQITSKSDGKKSEYDSSLNPFADDNAADTDVSESINKPVKPVKQKLMPLNPFEFSDDEDEEEKIVDNRKKLMPDDLAMDKKTKRSPQPKRGQIILPDAHVKKATPKKKLAPPAPQTPPTQSTPDVQSKLSENKENTQTQHSRRKTNENTPQGKGNSKLDDIDEDSTLSIDMQKKKHKPAPPRPMPPKRRPQSDYGVDPDNISQELKAIERKQAQLEEKGRQLEQAIRNADETLGSQEMNNDDDEDLLTSWLETVNEKNHLVRRESELIFISQHHALETKQADIEWQLREIMHRAENLKTDDDKLREESLLQQLVSLVTERSKLVDKMDDERLRQQDEDRKINMMLGSTAKSSVDNSKSANKKGGASAEKKGKKKDKKIK